MKKILYMTDLHIKVDSRNNIDILQKSLEDHSCDIIIMGGDTLHSFEKVYVQALNIALKFIKFLANKGVVYILVGNHDYINNHQFLTEDHWLNCLKDINNIVIVDKPMIIDNDIALCPYVFPGRLKEALNLVLQKRWLSVKMIFIHQEMKNCKMGCVNSLIGDTWNLNHPTLISGHIHDKQYIQQNIFYPGQSVSNKQIAGFWTFDDLWTFHKVNYPIEKNVCLNIDTFENTPLGDVNRITFKGSVSEIKAFKESEVYKGSRERGMPIFTKRIDSTGERSVLFDVDKYVFDECLKNNIVDIYNKFFTHCR